MLTNYVFVMREGIGDDILLEIDAVERHSQQKNVFWSLVRKGALYSYNCILPLGQGVKKN